MMKTTLLLSLYIALICKSCQKYIQSSPGQSYPKLSFRSYCLTQQIKFHPTLFRQIQKNMSTGEWVSELGKREVWRYVIEHCKHCVWYLQGEAPLLSEQVNVCVCTFVKESYKDSDRGARGINFFTDWGSNRPTTDDMGSLLFSLFH